jgi:ferric-dicitrate binding protein FerR (iron transport regulator)
VSGHVKGLIDEVLTGRVLSAKDDADFQAHLRGCEACRAHYDLTLGVLRLARGGSSVNAPGEAQRQTDRALRLVKPIEPTATAWPWRAMFAGAVALAAVLVTFFLWPRAPIGAVLSAGKGLTVDGVVATKDTVLLERAVVATEKEDAAVLLRDEAHKRGVLLRPNSKVKLLSVDEVQLEAGRVRLQVKEPKEPLVVRTESLRVVQNTAGVFIVEKRPTGTLIAVHQGKVTVRPVTGSAEPIELVEGQEAELSPTGALTPARPVANTSLIEDRGDGTVWDAILRFLRQLLDVIGKALSGD